jgi:hypothetical protein
MKKKNIEKKTVGFPGLIVKKKHNKRLKNTGKTLGFSVNL